MMATSLIITVFIISAQEFVITDNIISFLYNNKHAVAVTSLIDNCLIELIC